MPALGRRAHTAGNITRYTIDYANWLLPGESLTTRSVVLDPEFTATVTDVSITIPTINSADELVFLLEGGSVDEVFTLAVQIETSMGELKNDSIEFFCIEA